MAKKEGRLPVSSILALIVGLLLTVSIALPFKTVYWAGAWVLGQDRTISWASGLTIAGGDPGFGIAGVGLVYLIPIGGIIGVFSGALGVVPRMRPKAWALGLLVLVGGLLGLVGGIVASLYLGSFRLPINEIIGGGVGLWGALILGTVEIMVGATIILRHQT